MVASLGQDLTFHHIGVACRRIADDAQQWTALGYVAETATFEDPLQGIRGQFIVGPGPRLELIEDLPDHHSVAPWIKRATKFYHLGFLCPDLESAIGLLESKMARVVRDPQPSVFFGDSRIVFLLMTDGSLIELIESN
jgi:methylmalonyl-CoA/ethylmalonyl-CoA epimerase